MGDIDSTRRTQWTPPPRPEWVQRLNEEGRCLDIKAVVPLDESSLINYATANTGLSDFGTNDWYEPFQRLLRSLDEEAELSLIGRMLTRSDLLMFLEGRLRVEDTYKRHPEIDDERIQKPFMVIGQGRSGTSFLLNLLDFDPDNAACKTWEAMFPAPPPESATYLSDVRIALADARVTLWNRVDPTMNAVHQLGGGIPTETIHLQAGSFQTPGWFATLGQVPSYNGYMEARGAENALRYEKRVLKLLQWKNPRKRWVLKSPDYMRYLPDVLKIFPDVRLIWTHRDPVKALASMVNTMGTLFWMRTDNVNMVGALDHLTDPAASAMMLTRPIDWLESGIFPHSQLSNIRYEELVADPLGTVERMYGQFGLVLSQSARSAMQAYLQANPRSMRPFHAYGLDRTAEATRERRAYQRYQDYFKVASEL